MYVPPQPQLASAKQGNPVSMGSVRAAAVAARQLRQVRQKKQQEIAPHSQLRPASRTTNSHAVPFHEKKHLNLKLNLASVPPRDAPPMFITHPPVTCVDPASTASYAPWETVTEDPRGRSDSSYGRPRRQSSVTLSLRSPEGVEFNEVANDGPEQLGRLTKRIKKLGKGAGGTVYLSLYLPTLRLVAVKEVVVYKEQERELVKHELHALHENLMSLDDATESPGGMWSRLTSGSVQTTSSPSACPYLVGFYGAYLLPAKCAISIVMEFMDMGSLQDLLDAKISIPEPILRHCAFCCMKALDHMHASRTIHRDIKPANILMNHKGDFKIADFGLAGTLSKSASFFSEFEGTMMYMAPERIQGQPYGYVSDLWSVGVSLFYLATGAYPFAVEDGFFGLEEAIVHDPLPPMPNRFSPECRNFVKGLMRRDPTQRLTARQALSHPFLRAYEGSSAHRSFGSLWEKVPLRHAAVRADDITTIAQLLASHGKLHKRRMSRGNDAPRPPPPSTLLGHLAHVFASHQQHGSTEAEAYRREQLQRLAEDCGVNPNELQQMLEQAIDTQ